MDELETEIKYIKQSIELAKIMKKVIMDERISFPIRNEYMNKVDEIMEEN